jgi:hypothetical protein
MDEVTLNLTYEDRSGSSDSYQKRVSKFLRSLRRNFTITVIKTLTANNEVRVDNIIRSLNPVLANVIYERLNGNIRASEKEVDQHDRILKRQSKAFVEFKRFAHSFEHYAKIFDIPLPVAEWDQMVAVQAEFDNVTDLSSEMWIVEKLTTHNWGRELVAVPNVLNDLRSWAPMTWSVINNAAKWTAISIAHVQNLVASDSGIISRETANTLITGLVMFLYFIGRKIMK